MGALHPSPIVAWLLPSAPKEAAFKQETQPFLGGNGEECSLTSRIHFPVPGLEVFYSIVYSGSEAEDAVSSSVLQTAAHSLWVFLFVYFECNFCFRVQLSLLKRERRVSERDVNFIAVLLRFSFLVFRDHRFPSFSPVTILLIPSQYCGDCICISGREWADRSSHVHKLTPSLDLGELHASRRPCHFQGKLGVGRGSSRDSLKKTA